MTAAATARRADPLAGAHVTFGRVLGSEWIKFTSLRSTVWTIAVTLVVMVGFALLMAWGMSFANEAPAGAEAPPMPDGAMLGLAAVTTSYGLAQIVMAVWGVLVISGEYSTGQIRSTLTAVPTRLPVLAAKGLLMALASFIVGALGVALSVLATAPILSSNDMALDLGDSATQQVLIGVPLYLTGITLLALGIGALVRHSAGGIAVVLGLIIVLPILTTIPLDFIDTIAPYFPSAAGERIVMGEMTGAVLTPWQGYGVFMIYVVAALAAAGVLLRRRDA
ncbi:ABC transporter permease [Ruania zhangjianzhongii]|uniref:ABC transporter permease n=1 Tax=Ruania zhangjianzhongii TaxID=2603206 RepID=UPI0011CA8ACE|nr:ABC transporter permease [Ruania zhangjianzhongii]